VGGSCGHCNEPSGSIKYWEFLEWLHNWQQDETGGACSTNREEEECVHDFDGKVRRKEPLEGPIRRREDNIKTDLRDIELGGMVWIDLAHDRD
jgi:hypothetical protein